MEPPGATVRTLWQGAPWSSLTFDGGILVGDLGERTAPAQVGAVSAVTGRPLWTASIADPDVLGLVPAGPVVIVEAGRSPSGHAVTPIGPLVFSYTAFDARSEAVRWRVAADGKDQRPPVAVAGNLLVTGDAAGRG